MPPVEQPVGQGSCLCGEIRYEVRSPATRVTNCHCSMCRKQHGAAFATYATYPKEAFRLVAGADRLQTYSSGPGNERQFCGNCGSSLFWHKTTARWIGVALGTLDTDPGRPIDMHIFTSDKAPWHSITDDLPQYETRPGPPPADPLP